MLHILHQHQESQESLAPGLSPLLLWSEGVCGAGCIDGISLVTVAGTFRL